MDINITYTASHTDYKYNDGGRSKYFRMRYKKDITGDCVIRAISIALDLDYKFVWESLFEIGKNIGHLPCDKRTFEKFLIDNRWIKQKTLTINNNRKYQLHDYPVKNCIVHTRRHLVAIKNGVVNDTWDSRNKYAYSYYTEVPRDFSLEESK
tara:strand:- start:622 stop:1077 length:456 start_codon:yes stop_codon:yes gene_type:complete